jgi:Zn-finger nucleic acid-binding protein
VVVAAMIPNPTKHLNLEGCPTCGMFWFDSRELAKIKESTSMKGGS